MHQGSSVEPLFFPFSNLSAPFHEIDEINTYTILGKKEKKKGELLVVIEGWPSGWSGGLSGRRAAPCRRLFATEAGADSRGRPAARGHCFRGVAWASSACPALAICSLGVMLVVATLRKRHKEKSVFQMVRWKLVQVKYFDVVLVLWYLTKFRSKPIGMWSVLQFRAH